MPLKEALTSADIEEIRQSVLGQADPLGVAAELAAAAEAGRLADPQDAGQALTLAAEIAESRAKLDAALRYVESSLAVSGTRDDNQVMAAHAVRARILFRLGRADEAMAELEPLRPSLNQHADAPAYVSAALAVGGRHRVAEEWLTEAVKTAVAERGGPDPATADEAGLLFFLLQQRHRIRHAIGAQHDAYDNMAERLETRLANASAKAAGVATDLLFWPQAEFGRLVERWPALTEAYGATWDEHRARLETELVRLTGTGRSNLAVLPATVDGLVAFAGSDGDPADPQTRTGYAQRPGATTGQIGWPPERNGACWCGSGNKYKKCCLPRSRR
ncbi:SEC-C metal-binding domain-containing protein [Actinoplanes sp. DH11]|uniref:SEC-C metal-binding domain-containing protein n=1 Tax=Actinoplanes sp. DH11 TaxID=2857011 RepID=UPI001E3E2757|nr:SEC-C metal-binding domain-containing protein [Actinoplanes sp. DH11]